MAYVAIARKWRPQTLDEIVGQPHITRTLGNALRDGRVHHALLFTGARGVGKTTAARAMARALNCERGPTPDPCGECPSCKDVLAGTSPDVIEIDGASNNSVDDIRDLRESVRYLPQRGRTKVYIVDEVHMLSKGAFNALLKTLEEPPPHVVFMFATTEPQKIPDTILSRVQRFDFKRIPANAVVDRLRAIGQAEGLEIPDDALRLVARAGEGSMRDAQSLLDQVVSFAGPKADAAKVAEVLGLVDRALLYGMLQGIVKHEPERCLETIEKVYGFGYDLGEFTSEMLEVLRNATLMVLSPASRKYVDAPAEELQQLEQLAQGSSPDVFVRAFEVLLDVQEQLARTPRPRLVLDLAVARLTDLRPAVPIDRLLDRLADLERRARAGGGSPRGPRARATPADPDADPEPAPRGPVPSARTAPAPTAGAAPAATAARALTPAAPGQPPTHTAAPAEEDRRWRAFLGALEHAGPRYAVWVHDTAFGGFESGVLSAVVLTEFMRNQAQVQLQDPKVLEAAAKAFGGTVRVQLRQRHDQDTHQTGREVNAERQRQELGALERDLAQDPVAAKVIQLFGATLERVVLAERTTPERQAPIDGNGTDLADDPPAEAP